MANTILEKVYVTKYALTKGIEEYENAEHCEETSSNMIIVRNGSNGMGYLDMYFHNSDWHLTKEEAVKKAEQMKQKQIQALEKKIAKLKKMVFAK